jgi:beta-N-acetylhexosaminidase
MSPYDLANYPEAGTQLAVYGMTAPGMAAAGEVLTGDTAPRGRLPVNLK